MPRDQNWRRAGQGFALGPSEARGLLSTEHKDLSAACTRRSHGPAPEGRDWEKQDLSTHARILCPAYGDSVMYWVCLKARLVESVVHTPVKP